MLARRGAARALVFCNKIETCRAVENHLLRTSERQQQKYKVRLCRTAHARIISRRHTSAQQVLVYHEAIRDELRASNLEAFLMKPLSVAGQAEVPVVMVATDRMSRGK